MKNMSKFRSVKEKLAYICFKKTIVGIKRLLYAGWICYTKERCQISIMLEVTPFELL